MRKFSVDRYEIFESIFNYTSDGIVVFDLDAKILDVNPAFEAMSGWSKKELVEQILPLTPPDELQEVMEHFRNVLLGNVPFTKYQGKKLRKDGTLVDIIATLSPIKDKAGNIIAIAGIAKDITELKRNQDIAIKLEKFSAISQLAAGIAHEIRNPLTSLKGFLKILKAKTSENLHYFEIMQSELERINLIVNEFMVLTKPQTFNFQLRDIRILLENVISLLNTLAILNNVQITDKFESDTILIMCDENQLKQVFINILKNAIEAMPNGGKISVKLKTKGEGVLICFSDDGQGIPAHLIPKVGEPFFTTKENGTGLGIMVCYNIIENHQGNIHIESELGKGTKVSVFLPFHKK